MKKNLKEISVTRRCPFCGKANTVECNENDYLDWQDGELIQNAMPYLSAQEREYLITGICEDCWAGMFDGMDTEDALYEEDN
jgi:hypothetical protein